MNIIGRFAKNLVDSIADTGEKFLKNRRLRGNSVQMLLELCDDLISHKGFASGIALAREVVNRYGLLTQNDKLKFFKELNKNMGYNLQEIKKVAAKFSNSPTEKTLQELSDHLKSKLQKLFSRMIMAPMGTQLIVSLREDLLGFIPSHSDLQAVDEVLRRLLISWFNPGFLVLKKIDWDTEASILEKIIEYETVHSIANWNDLKSRLAANRKCFAYFHPALEDEPLIFVEVALTKGISRSIQSIINEEADLEKKTDTAIFYSINNCQRGLKKIPLGNFLIKMVVTELAYELPSIKKYSTLSPIPGFATWLRDELKIGGSQYLPENDIELLQLINDSDWYKDSKKRNELKKPLIKACANYLVLSKKNGNPINSVARFHFGNGAQLYRINWMGNTSEYGITKSFGLMVNYLYDPKQIEANHEAYLQKGELALSKSIYSILGS